jgi:putative transposase
MVGAGATKQPETKTTMTQKNRKTTVNELKAVIGEDQDLIRGIVQIAVQEFLEAEMNEALGAAKGERSEGRLGYRSGHYPRKLIARVGTLELHGDLQPLPAQ